MMMPPEPGRLSLKVVIRCRDFEASRRFYGDVIGLPVLDAWDEAGGQGCIFGFPNGGSLEVYQMQSQDKRYDASFERAFQDDKIDLQLRTEDLDAWVRRLEGQWPFKGPRSLPWGDRWLQLRDPDNLLVAIVEASK
jgi:catechol 2,3-dioxygenase-like lactoylglutathione lyase family enzyme